MGLVLLLVPAWLSSPMYPECPDGIFWMTHLRSEGANHDLSQPSLNRECDESLTMTLLFPPGFRRYLNFKEPQGNLNSSNVLNRVEYELLPIRIIHRRKKRL